MPSDNRVDPLKMIFLKILNHVARCEGCVMCVGDEKDLKDLKIVF